MGPTVALSALQALQDVCWLGLLPAVMQSFSTAPDMPAELQLFWGLLQGRPRFKVALPCATCTLACRYEVDIMRCPCALPQARVSCVSA